MSLFSYVLTDVIHLIKIVILCDLFFMFERRNDKNRKLIFVSDILIMLVVSLSIYFYENKLVGIFIYVAAIIICVFGLYKEKLLGIVFSSIWIIAIMSMLDIMSTVLVDTIGDFLGFSNDDMTRVLAGIVSLVFVVIIGYIYKKEYCKGIKTLGVGNILLFSMLTVADTFVVMVMAAIEINQKYKIQILLNSIAFIIVILGIFIQLAAVILLFTQRNVYKEKEQLTKKYLEEQIKHYEYLERREYETKKFRHDLRSHLQMLSNLATNGQYNKIDDYLDMINVRIESFGNEVTVQNGTVDAIINQYYSRAKYQGIDMSVKGKFPNECYIDAFDLCTIFSNVLSNALEAASKADNKKISVDCRYNDKKVIINVINTYKDEGQFNSDSIETSKDNVDYHGYGLANIRQSLKKYNGVLNIETDNGEFALKISLNNAEKRNYEDSGC